jgi:hypothetical protein
MSTQFRQPAYNLAEYRHLLAEFSHFSRPVRWQAGPRTAKHKDLLNIKNCFILALKLLVKQYLYIYGKIITY